MNIIRKIRKLTLLLVLVFGFNLTLFGALPAYAANPVTAKNDICQGIGAATGSDSCNSASGAKSINHIISLVINILSLIVGVAALIIIIISGLKFVISNGDSNSINSARTSLIYALVGLVVAGMAQVIVHFVLNKTAGS